MVVFVPFYFLNLFQDHSQFHSPNSLEHIHPPHMAVIIIFYFTLISIIIKDVTITQNYRIFLRS